MERPANADMMQGYSDGFDISSPEPSGNRSRSYRHGFASGRADRNHKSRGRADELRAKADHAMAADDADAIGPLVLSP